MWLPWKDAVWIGSAIGLSGVAIRPVTTRWADYVRPFIWESTAVFYLYALWQWGGRFNFIPPDGALDRGRRIWELERDVFLPSEVWLQHQVLGGSWFVQACNIYYFVVHVPAMIAVLIWLFVKHRPTYRPIRNVLTITTAVSLVAHFVPVAPPRMFPDLGFVDTALLYGQSAYGPPGTGVSNQVGALPSVHVLWAGIVAVGIWVALRRSGSRWRWLGVAHLIATVAAVTLTANHWWFDSLSALALIPMAWWLQRAVLRRLSPAAERIVAARVLSPAGRQRVPQ